MTNTAAFCRKQPSIGFLKREDKASRPEDRRKFIIEKVIELTQEAFDDFAADLLEDQEFIIKNRDLMRERNGVWHCLLVEPAGAGYGILVESEGYDYARYAAYYTDHYNAQ